MLEDDDLFGELLETVLAGSGRSVDVTVCSSLTEAYMALGGGFDLVVTDWNLPDGSGLDLVKKIRSQDKQVPVVVVSARADRESVLKAAHYGINGYITKPVDINLLHSRLAQFFPVKGQEQASVSEYLEASLGRVVQLSSGMDLVELLKLIDRESELSPAQLAERWRDEPALTARLLDVANSTSFRRTGQPVESLRDAISSIGVAMSLNQALALSLDVSGSVRLEPLKEIAEAVNQNILRVSQSARELAIKLGLQPAIFQQAALLSRLGELAVIKVLDVFHASGGQVEEGQLEKLVEDWSKPFGNRLKVQWHLPLGLRELIGAVHVLPGDSTQDRQLIMRAAALAARDEPDNEEYQRLIRRLGLDKP